MREEGKKEAKEEEGVVKKYLCAISRTPNS
jgi:hypothetical protein